VFGGSGVLWIFKVIFALKYIKIIFFKKKLFLILAYQNNLKTLKK
jgi:hypothetical protein